MLKRILTQKRYLKNIYKAQKGITGLETAIILIAFVVVAAVFAYTVLSAGLFSTQKSQEAVYSGLQSTQNTLELKGAVLTNSQAVLDACESTGGWTVYNSATKALSTGTMDTNMKEGTNALQLTLKATVAANGAVSTHAAAPMSGLKTGDTLTFWAKVDNNADINTKLSFGLSTADETAGGAFKASLTSSAPITFTDGAWHQYSISLSAADATGVFYGVYANAGFTYAADRVALIDDIEISDPSGASTLTGFANQLVLTLGLANGGQPVDFTEAIDGDGDFILTGDTQANRTNKIVINYSDDSQQVSDLYWTKSFIGAHAGSGNLLDQSDKVRVTVDLNYINKNAPDVAHKVGPNRTFTLEVKTSTGAVLTIQRTMPARVHTIEDLH